MDSLSFNIIKKNIYVKNNNLDFIIKSECFLESKGITLKRPKIKTVSLILSKKNENQKKIIDIIGNFYNKISEFIELQEEFNPNMIINPLKNIDNDTYILYVYITDWEGNIIAKLYDTNNEIIDINKLNNKTFKIYPAICINNITLSNKDENAYINISLKEGYIKDIENKRILDYNKIKEIIEKEKKENLNC